MSRLVVWGAMIVALSSTALGWTSPRSGATTSQARSAPATRTGKYDADRSGGQAPARSRHHHAKPTGPRRTLVRLDPPSPGPLTLVSQVTMRFLRR
jgi:hypothetical protein